MRAHKDWGLGILRGLTARFSDEEVLKRMHDESVHNELVAQKRARLSTVEAAIVELETKRARFVQSGNAVDAKRLLASDFVAVVEGGLALTRDEYVKEVATGSQGKRPDYVAEVIRVGEGTEGYWAFGRMAYSTTKHKLKYKVANGTLMVKHQVPWPHEEFFVPFRTPLSTESPQQ